MTSYFDSLTPEQREENRRKALAAQEAHRAHLKSQAHLLHNKFADKPLWRRLASKYGVRMPPDYIPGSEVRYVRKAMRKAGVLPEHVREAFGGDVKFLARTNPTWPAYALIGLILELAESKPILSPKGEDDLI